MKIKKATVGFSLAAAIGLCAFFLPGRLITEQAFSNSSVVPCVIIDAGHGGFDGGATSENGTLEKDINLAVSLKTEAVLGLFGYRTVMTRRDDTPLAANKKDDMYARLDILKEHSDAIFLSIHQNHFSQEKYYGAQMFYGSVCESESESLAKILKQSFLENVNSENKREIKKAYADLFLYKNAPQPCVLIECGFISNNKEERLLKDNSYQQKIAFSIAESVDKYYDSIK